MMIGTRKLGKQNSEKFCSKNQKANVSEEAITTKNTEKREFDAGTTENEMVKTTTLENSEKDNTSSVNNTSFNLDVSDNPYIMSPIACPPETPELPPIVDGYNPRKMGRDNLRPNPKPYANAYFIMLDSFTTGDLCQAQNGSTTSI